MIDTGFSKKTLTDLKSEIEQAERDSISSSLNLLATSVLGQINGIFADKLRELWDVAEAVYRAFYPDSASGEALDNVAAITGAVRLPATQSTVTLRLFLDSGVTVPEGSLVSVGEVGSQFQTIVAVTNSLGYAATVSVEAVSVDFGPVVALSGSIDTIQSPISGWSAATAISSGSSETFNLDDAQTLTVKVDGGTVQTATFNTADFVDINAATAAEVAAVINSDISGVSASDEGGYVRITNDSEASGNSIEVTGGTANTALGFSTDLIQGFNALDAALGRDLETDEDFRYRREALLAVTGSCTVEAIRADVLSVDGVESCHVFENDTGSDTGYSGYFKAHSFEACVLGGDDQDIADKIWQTKPAGIYTSAFPGLEVVKTVTDSQGFGHDIRFTRPYEIDIYIDVTVKLSDSPPLDIDDQIKAILVAEGENIGVGEEVIALHYHAAPLEVSGVEDVTIFKIDVVFPPTNTANLSPGTREIARFDTSRIRVYHV